LLTAKQHDFFGRDFFGRLIIEIRPEQGRSYFVDADLDLVPWEPHGSQKIEDGVYSMTSGPKGEEQSRIVGLRGECIVVEVPEFGFDEWFCRIP